MGENYETVKLTYSIHKCSSFSANYEPRNIMVNSPANQLSRWFTDGITPSQFIILKLKSPAIVETILFGKYIKPHVSDLRRFEVFGGIDEENMSMLLSTGLKNDNIAETFRLRHRTREGLYLPVKYIKVVPLQSWGPVHNFSIWYLELHGKNDEELLKTAMHTISLRKEEEAVRIVLKHLRRRHYKDAYEALSRETGVRLEGAVQAKFWNALVENGDYKLAEQILDEAAKEGEFEWYMSWLPYKPVWRQLSPCSPAVEEGLGAADAPPPPPRSRRDDLLCADREPQLDNIDAHVTNGGRAEERCSSPSCCSRPGPRGGHQLVVDPTTGNLYLFGGWNGTTDLDDLWTFDVTTERWSLLCASSGLVGGPSPRSCHKMVFDPVYKQLYTLGRYLDNAQRLPENMKCDLYMYDVTSASWSLVCSDATAAGGPRLVFDHQMCLDADARAIYVFGGRVLPASTDEAASPQYSGLYAYYIESEQWQCLLDADRADGPQSRVGHSMLFHPGQRRLYMFAGQRNKEQLLDLWWHDVATGASGSLGAAPRRTPPLAGFTQRATLDPQTDEMFVLSSATVEYERAVDSVDWWPRIAAFSKCDMRDTEEMFWLYGMNKEKDRRVQNTMWVFSLRTQSCACVYRSARAAPGEPRPRFAHQLVYDPIRKVHYLFGGNPGSQQQPRLRLDDLWSLQLERPSLDHMLAKVRSKLREARFREMAVEALEQPSQAAAALQYLRRDVYEVLDHDDDHEVEQFQKLATVLFSGGSSGGVAPLVRLAPPWTRRLAARRAQATRLPRPDLASLLAAVLGADDSVPDFTQPLEELSAPSPDTWDVGAEGEGEPPRAWAVRAARVKLCDRLAQLFRPSTVAPDVDVADLVDL